MNDRLRNAIHSGVKFGGAAAVINLVRYLPVVAAGTVPASFFATVLLVSFAAVGGVAFVLVMLGVAWVTPKSPRERIVSTWFMWMVAVALAGFVVEMLLKLDPYSFMSWGSLGAGAWAVAVLVLWVVFRLRDRRRRDLSAPNAEQKPSGR